MSKIKVLIFDIETSPIIARVWGLKDQNIGLSQIRDDWFVIAWAAKWLGEKKVHYCDQRNSRNLGDDKALVLRLWLMLDEADIVITQNGKNFDSPKLNARFIMHGFKPPSPYRHLDTYQIARKVAKFTSNKLEYLAEKLCTKYKKLKHSKYPGMDLWNECLKGNLSAWKEMEKYNKHDVLATEELYNKLKAWAPDAMPQPYLLECTVCGKGPVYRRGTTVTNKGRFMRYQCQACGKWATAKQQRQNQGAKI